MFVVHVLPHHMLLFILSLKKPRSNILHIRCHVPLQREGLRFVLHLFQCGVMFTATHSNVVAESMPYVV
jgi:hypothetical protein